jgi:hypothetical protein
MSTIGANEFVFYKDDEGDIYSGGFRVNSILMKQGFSPMTTLNSANSQMGGDSNNTGNVSDLFNDLVVPNWALAFPFKQSGGDYKQEKNMNKKEEDDENDVLDEDIHTKLLSMLQPTSEMKKSSRKNKKKHFNKTKRIKHLKLKYNKV